MANHTKIKSHDANVGEELNEEWQEITSTDQGSGKRGMDVEIGNSSPVPVEVTGSSVTSVAVTTTGSVTDATITSATDQKLLIVQPLGTATWYWSFDTGSAVTSSNGNSIPGTRALVLNNVEADIRIGTGTAQDFLVSKGT